MKEFTSQVGGRYTYIDDILNLQELSLAIVSLFDGCDNFIISGCQLSGTTLTPGYVYINGKIRYCAGMSKITTWPIYIYENNTVEKVSYVDSGDKIGRNIYGCAVGTSVPTSTDLLTGVTPQFIKMTNGGSAMRLKDAFFGKYALALDSSYSSQTVNKSVALNNDLTVNGVVQSNSAFKTISGNNKGTISYNSDGDLTIQSTNASSTYKMVIANNGVFKFFVGDVLLATIASTGFIASVPFTTTRLNVGSISCQDNNIYNNSTGSDSGAVKINMLGYSDASNAFYRNTIIGNGKGSVILNIVGQTRQCYLYGDLVIASSNAATLKLCHDSLAKTDPTLRTCMNWLDKNGEVIATIGYDSPTDYDLYINNKLGRVRIENDTFIKENLFIGGTNITNIYVNKKDFLLSLNNKANASDVYSKTTADAIFVKRADGISAFVENAGGGEAGKKSVRDDIGAISTSDLNKSVLKAQLFKDIVAEGLPDVSSSDYTSALKSRQRSLCENIGAVYKDDAQVAQKDTGWVSIENQNNSPNTKLYIRQVGHVVSIQGELYTPHAGVVFTIPNMIDPPTHKIGYSCYKGGEWTCYIAPGSRVCAVDTCNNGCSKYVGFLMTYII